MSVVIDKEAAVKRMGDDESLYLEIVEDFLGALPGQIDMLQSVVDEGNAADAEMQSHGIKAAAGSVGADKMTDVARRIEEKAKGGNLAECPDLMLELQSEFDSVAAFFGAKTDTLRCLVVEDDPISRKVLQKLLSTIGECDVAVNGQEGFDKVLAQLDGNSRYDLVCLDIMMPVKSGMDTLEMIRAAETERGIEMFDGVKIIMTSALNDKDNVLGAFRQGCEAYVVKPVDRTKLFEEMKKLGLKTNKE